MRLYVEIVAPKSRRYSFRNHKPYDHELRISRVLKNPPNDWSTAGYWKVLEIPAEIEKFANYTVVEES